MADQKLTALTDAGSVVGTDITYVVTTPGGTPASKKITITELFQTPGVAVNLGIAYAFASGNLVA